MQVTVTIPSVNNSIAPLTVDIECPVRTSRAKKLRLAVLKAIELGRPLTNLKLSDLDLSGIDFKAADLQGSSLTGADLSKSDLDFCTLSGANFYGANLTEATLNSVVAQDATFDYANMTRVSAQSSNFYRSSLPYANLTDSNLTAASLCQCDLLATNFTGSDISGITLSGVTSIGKAHFEGVVINKETVKRLVTSLPRNYFGTTYEFTAFELTSGIVKILAGCRWFTIAEYRRHINHYPSNDKRAYTAAILNFIAERAAYVIPEYLTPHIDTPDINLLMAALSKYGLSVTKTGNTDANLGYTPAATLLKLITNTKFTCQLMNAEVTEVTNEHRGYSNYPT